MLDWRGLLTLLIAVIIIVVGLVVLHNHGVL